MVDLGGTARAKFAGSGTLSVVEIHLSQDTPQEVIQQILALVVDSSEEQETPTDQPAVVDGVLRIKGVAASSFSSADVQPSSVRLIPVESKTGKASLMASLAVILCLSTITFNVTGTADNILQFLEHYRTYFHTKVDGLVVPIDQAKQTIQNAEHPQPTPKNEHPEKSGNPSAILSEGD